MGFLDRFRRRRAVPTAPATAADLDEPRLHHYAFAHLALRGFALSQPLTCLGLLASPHAGEFLADVLAHVVAQAGPDEPPADFDSAECVVTTTRIGGYPGAVVALPRPRAVAEAHLVAVVALVDPDADAPPPNDAEARYFTLEKGIAPDGTPRTVLGEWTREATHANYGDGPPPTPAAFAAAIARLLGRG